MYAARNYAYLVALLLSGIACDRTAPTPAKGMALENLFTRPGSSTLEKLPRGIAAYVNDEKISADLLAAYQQTKQSQQATSLATPSAQLDELINLRLLVQKARQMQLDNTAHVQTLLELQADALIAQTYLDQFTRQLRITEADLKQAYQKQYVETPAIEYKTRHILVKTRKEATEIMRALAQGEDFATLARKHSRAPDASFGGALEWFRPETVSKRFSEAVFRLGENELSREPIKTEHGWHVILLENKRKALIPAFPEVRTTLYNRLRQEEIEKHLKELRKHSQIKINPTEP